MSAVVHYTLENALFVHFPSIEVGRQLPPVRCLPTPVRRVHPWSGLEKEMIISFGLEGGTVAQTYHYSTSRDCPL